MPAHAERDSGLVHLESRYSVLDTSLRLETVLKEHGLRIFARIDHSGEAINVGLRLRPTLVFLFGSPMVGTPLMVASPTLGMDLPFKAMVWQDEARKVWLSYNTPEYLKHRHHVPEWLIAKLAPLVDLLSGVVR